MFYVYADGNSIFNPMDDSLAIFSPKVTLELGKSGSFQFSIPSTNEYYDYLEQIKTDIVVEIDKTEIFRGRILSITRGFNNIKSVYCEGILSYLVDSVQKARRFDGYAKKLYEDILKRHNDMVESKKRFSIGLGMFDDDLENARVVIPGKKEEGDAYYGENKYEQAIIESIVGEWQTTYDYLNTIFLNYLGGYLIARHDPTTNKNYIDYISSESLDNKILASLNSNIVDHEIEFGVNMIDFSEEINAEDMFTVLIPLGDGEEDTLTIAGATNKYSDGNIELVKVKGQQIGIADRKARAEYGTIVKTFAFENVNQANTLFTNGVRYLKLHKNIPITYTIKAVDLHFVNGSSGQIEIGDTVRINSSPHGVSKFLICTRIEYDLANPANTSYTFGNPQQTLTERYKKNKDKDKNDSDHNDKRAAKGGGGAAGAARDDAYYGAYDLFAPAKDWIDKYGTYAEYAISWYDEHSGGAVRAYAWVNGYGAGAERTINWYNEYASGAIRAYDWVTQYGAASEKTIDWYDDHAAGAIRAYDWISSYGAGAEKSISWYDYHAAGAIRAYDWISSYGASAEKSIYWYYNNATGIIAAKQWVSANGAKAVDSINWYYKNAGGAVNTIKWVNDNSAGIENSVRWYNNNGSYSLASINQKATDSGSKIDLIATFEGKSGSFSIKSFKNVLTNKISSMIEAQADNISLRAKDTIVAAAKEVTIDAVFKEKGVASFSRGVIMNGSLTANGTFATNDSVNFNNGFTSKMNGTIEANLIVKGTSITVGGKEVARKDDLTDGLSKKLDSSDFTKTNIESLLKGKTFSSVGAYFRDAIGCKTDDGVTTLSTFVDNRIKKIVDSGFLKEKISGKDSSKWGEYLRGAIGCTDGGKAVSLKSYVEDHSVTKAHTHKFRFMHTHQYTYKDGTNEKTANTKPASISEGTTVSAGK